MMTTRKSRTLIQDCMLSRIFSGLPKPEQSKNKIIGIVEAHQYTVVIEKVLSFATGRRTKWVPLKINGSKAFINYIMQLYN